MNANRIWAGVAWLVLWGAVGAAGYLISCGAAAAWAAVSWAGCKRVFSFIAFWSLVFSLIQALWHLGSLFKAKARKA